MGFLRRFYKDHPSPTNSAKDHVQERARSHDETCALVITRGRACRDVSKLPGHEDLQPVTFPRTCETLAREDRPVSVNMTFTLVENLAISTTFFFSFFICVDAISSRYRRDR